MPDEVPLIYTSKGNLPIADLTCKVEWMFAPNEACFVEEYFLGEESVKRAVHIYKPEGLVSEGSAASIG